MQAGNHVHPTAFEYHLGHPNQCYMCRCTLKAVSHRHGSAKLCSSMCCQRYEQVLAPVPLKPADAFPAISWATGRGGTPLSFEKPAAERSVVRMRSHQV